MYILILILVAGAFIFYTWPEPEKAEPVFADPALTKLIQAALEPGGDLLTITRLEGDGQGLYSLEGIESLRNLENLSLQDNSIEDLTPLAGLLRLRKLDLRNNQVSNLEPLAGLANLRNLDLRGNRVTNITPLRGMVGLSKLNLRDNMVSDLSPLAGLRTLKELNLRGNLLSDITPLAGLEALLDLNIRENRIADIGPLENLPLTTRLYLEKNPIVDFRPVENSYGNIADKDFTVDIGFSVSGGFYRDSLQLELYSFLADAVIYYTLDGSEPDPKGNSARTFLYQDPLTLVDCSHQPNVISLVKTTNYFWPGPPKGVVFKGTPVKARAFVQGEPVGYSCAHTYFLSPDAPDRYSLPVVSLTTSPENLFDKKKGIYVPGDRYREGVIRSGNYYGRGAAWEREAYLEFYEADGRLVLNQNIGIRIHGNITRAWPQKSLRLYARSEYGKARFQYPFFSDRCQEEYKRLLLRSAGNDMRLAFFRDALAHRLLEDTTSLDLQAYRPVIVFINGEYWGIHNLRERLDNHYLASKYGVDKEDVVVLEGNAVLNDGQPGDQNHYKDMLAFLRSHEITDPEVYAQMNTLMDMENFIDYQIAEIYFANTDWPFNNVMFWRLKTEAYNPDAPYGLDGRWRWMVFDTDYGFGLAENPEHNTLSWAVSTDEWATVLLRTLLENPQFRAQFIARFSAHLNITFAPARVLSFVDGIQAALAPEMAEHLQRWPYISSVKRWKENVDVIRDFARRRPDCVREHLRNRFKLESAALVSISGSLPVAGTVAVNGLETGLPFAGKFFPRIPLEIRAIPAPGYEFSCWQGDWSGDDPVITCIPGGDMVLEAVFTPVP